MSYAFESRLATLCALHASSWLAEELTSYRLLNMLQIVGDRPVITLGGNRSDEKGHRGQLAGARRSGAVIRLRWARAWRLRGLSPEGVVRRACERGDPPAGARGLGSAATERRRWRCRRRPRSGTFRLRCRGRSRSSRASPRRYPEAAAYGPGTRSE